MSDLIRKHTASHLKRQRTIDLVESSIKKIQQSNLPVSIETIITASKVEDPLGKGISRSGLLQNPAAYALYAAHRNWVPKRKRSLKRRKWADELKFIRIAADKNAKRRRLKEYTKRDLIEILVELSERYCTLETGMLQESIKLYDAL